MAHAEQEKLSIRDRAKKATAVIGATALLAGAGAGLSGCFEGKAYVVKDPKTGKELELTKEQYEGYQLWQGTPTTSEAGAGNGDTTTSTIVESPKADTTTTSVNSEVTDMETPSASEEVKGVEFGSVVIAGAPEKVDPGVVDTAKGDFKNTIGLGSEMAFAEPGVLLVGPDFGYTGSENPMGKNPEGWNSMYESGGSIRPFSSVSQEVIRFEEPAYQNLPEGGWVLASAAEMTAKIGDVTIKLNHKENNNYFLVVRGLYGDVKQDTDRNETIEFTDYKPGHLLVNMYESRDETNAAFISEGQFKQMAETSHSHGTNGGDGGNSILTVVCYDANTKAYAVIEQKLDRNTDTSGNWKSVASNWLNK